MLSSLLTIATLSGLLWFLVLTETEAMFVVYSALALVGYVVNLVRTDAVGGNNFQNKLR